MTLNSKVKQSGFTIVELLIVIVVIAILAAITIVAYNGIQNRAKASAAQSLANNIAKKVESFNTIESLYPTYTQLTSNVGDGTQYNSKEAKLDNSAQVTDAGAANATLTLTNEKTVLYRKCTNGAAIYYYDAVNNKIAAIGVGGQASIAPSVGTTTACA